jgi:hypothetical protein
MSRACSTSGSRTRLWPVHGSVTRLPWALVKGRRGSGGCQEEEAIRPPDSADLPCPFFLFSSTDAAVGRLVLESAL